MAATTTKSIAWKQQQQQYHTQQQYCMEATTLLSSFDVIVDRGRSRGLANAAYRGFLEKQLFEYCCKNKKEKREMASKLVATWKSVTGGRFITMNQLQWCELSIAASVKYTMKVLASRFSSTKRDRVDAANGIIALHNMAVETVTNNINQENTSRKYAQAQQQVELFLDDTNNDKQVKLVPDADTNVDKNINNNELIPDTDTNNVKNNDELVPVAGENKKNNDVSIIAGQNVEEYPNGQITNYTNNFGHMDRESDEMNREPDDQFTVSEDTLEVLHLLGDDTIPTTNNRGIHSSLDKSVELLHQKTLHDYFPSLNNSVGGLLEDRLFDHLCIKSFRDYCMKKIWFPNGINGWIGLMTHYQRKKGHLKCWFACC